MTTPALEDHLALIYAERHGFGGKGAGKAFAEAVAKDPDLAEAARARLAELDALHSASEGRIEERCVLSHAHREGLRSALGIV